jgi:hypothetical protein
MSTSTARAVSLGVLGSLMALLFLTQGLLSWAAFLGWAGFLAAGGDSGALRKSIAGNVLGALLGWTALLLMTVIVVDAESYLWIPRAVIAMAVTLFILGLATKADLFSNLTSGLLGYAAVIGALAVPMLELKGWARLTGLHLYNPLIQVVLSMIGGAVFGLIAGKLEAAFSKG